MNMSFLNYPPCKMQYFLKYGMCTAYQVYQATWIEPLSGLVLARGLYI